MPSNYFLYFSSFRVPRLRARSTSARSACRTSGTPTLPSSTRGRSRWSYAAGAATSQVDTSLHQRYADPVRWIASGFDSRRKLYIDSYFDLILRCLPISYEFWIQIRWTGSWCYHSARIRLFWGKNPNPSYDSLNLMHNSLS